MRTIFLRDALALITEATGACRGYIELYAQGGNSDQPAWSSAHNLMADEVSTIRHMISRGIISEAVAVGETILTTAALLDERFRTHESVRLGQIEAVLCAPIGADPPSGVIYLESPTSPDTFGLDEQRCAEAFARHSAPLVRRLLDHRHRQDAAASDDWRHSLRLGRLVCHSPAFGAVLKQVALLAQLDVTVLLTGASGAGKSLLARLIHDNGPRGQQPFVEVSCGALPDTLIESELFGALAGAHSTATQRLPGKVEAARHGTLLLDEIDVLSLASQSKLLQLLQSKQYYPLGSAHPIAADVRVIAATNSDLQRAVAERRFREDLLYRLQVVPLRLPSLSERAADIRPLAEMFRREICTRHGLPLMEFSPNARRALEEAAWPGNVRQLEHAIEAGVIRAATAHANEIGHAHLFPGMLEPPSDLTYQQATQLAQRHIVASTLEASDWNIPETARRLDVTRAHVYNLIRAFGLARQANGNNG